MFQILEDELDFDRPGRGVACSIPVSSIAGKKALEMILNKKETPSYHDVSSR